MARVSADRASGLSSSVDRCVEAVDVPDTFPRRTCASLCGGSGTLQCLGIAERAPRRVGGTLSPNEVVGRRRSTPPCSEQCGSRSTWWSGLGSGSGAEAPSLCRFPPGLHRSPTPLDASRVHDPPNEVARPRSSPRLPDAGRGRWPCRSLRATTPQPGPGRGPDSRIPAIRSPASASDCRGCRSVGCESRRPPGSRRPPRVSGVARGLTPL